MGHSQDYRAGFGQGYEAWHYGKWRYLAAKSEEFRAGFNDGWDSAKGDSEVWGV